MKPTIILVTSNCATHRKLAVYLLAPEVPEQIEAAVKTQVEVDLE